MSRYNGERLVRGSVSPTMPFNVPGSESQQDCDALVTIFNNTFAESENTLLFKGGAEPIYLPQSDTEPFHRIIFTRDYFSSALHEIAHWCVAGPQRRQLEDYGYWYTPDGRDAEQQQKFEKVEVKPQALEWIFHRACARPFRVSADNLEAGVGASDTFKAAICQQAQHYCLAGLPSRAGHFVKALREYFATPDPLLAVHYAIDRI